MRGSATRFRLLCPMPKACLKARSCACSPLQRFQQPSSSRNLSGIQSCEVKSDAQKRTAASHKVQPPSSVKRICHSARSEAEWRNLHFFAHDAMMLSFLKESL